MQLNLALLKAHKFGISLAVMSALILAGCGGGGTPPAVISGTRISGTVAAGAAVSNGVGYALDATTGTQISFVTSSTGSYSVDLANKTGPFLIHVRGTTVGGLIVDLYSLASTTNLGATVNVTPLSDVVVGYAAGMIGNALERACTTNISVCPALLNGIVAKLALSNSNIVGALPPSILAAFAITPASFNAITSTFTANHSGVDGLLDALQVLPPAAGATTGSYAINLNGATVTPLVTIPVSVAATSSVPATNPTAPTTLQVTQASNLATALKEVQAWASNYNTTYATQAPTPTQWLAMLDPAFSFAGQNATQFSSTTANQFFPAGTTMLLGSLAPYSGAPWPTGATTPGASVTYDPNNNCVTSLWSHTGRGGILFLMNKTITNATGCIGTWLLAGDGSTYSFFMDTSHIKSVNPAGITYESGMQLMVDSAYSTGAPAANIPAGVTPFALATITGPGFATAGNPNAASGSVSFVAPTPVAPPNTIVTEIKINDTYYNPYSPLEDCAVVSAANVVGGRANPATPCYNANAIAGSDYVIRWYAAPVAPATTGVLLHSRTVRLATTPGAGGVPLSWYPTITSITPTASTSIPLGISTVTVNWSLPIGSMANGADVFLYDNVGAQLAHSWTSFSPTATSGSTSITTAAVPSSGWVTFSSNIGGYNVSSGKPF